MGARTAGFHPCDPVAFTLLSSAGPATVVSRHIGRPMPPFILHRTAERRDGGVADQSSAAKARSAACQQPVQI